MFRKILMTAAAVGALTAASAAAGQVQVGGGLGVGLGAGVQGGGLGVGLGTGVNAGGAGQVGIGGLGATTDIDSRGALDAATGGRVGAGVDGQLSGSAVVSGPVAGLHVGMDVVGAGNARLGKVERIVASSSGKVKRVLVRSLDGRRVFPLPPQSVSVAGHVATTTAASATASR